VIYQSITANDTPRDETEQRFWSALLISMKMPTVFEAIETEIAAGNVAVVQLVSTSEAILDRRLAELARGTRPSRSGALSPRHDDRLPQERLPDAANAGVRDQRRLPAVRADAR
jgi:hypothetical protein